MRAFIVATALALSLLWNPAVLANLYYCTDSDGRMWVRNYKVPGEKCALAMDTGSDKAAEKSQKTTKSSSRYKPPSDTPRVLKEPTKTKERLALYKALIQEAAEKYQLPVVFVQAVMRVESNFKYRAVSQAGAQGLMQLMPKTGLSMGVRDPFDPRQNIMGGSRLLRVLANRFDGDIVKILSAYHAGSGAVAAKGGIPYETTEGYVRAVLDHYYRYKDV